MLINPIETSISASLHYAAEQGKLAICKDLISNGPNVNNLDNLERTPLRYAAQQRKSAICKQLISKGANVNTLDNNNETPILFAADQEKLSVCKLLISKGANINTLDTSDRTALHYAARRGSIAVCKLLISEGANINVSDSWNKTPLMLAIREKHVAVTEYFLENNVLKKFLGDKSEKDIYLSMLTWLVKRQTLEVAQTRNWFWKLCSLAFKKTNTLKSICRNLIIKDASHVQVCYNFEGFNIPEVLKNYLKFKEELQILLG